MRGSAAAVGAALVRLQVTTRKVVTGASFMVKDCKKLMGALVRTGRIANLVLRRLLE